MAVYHQSWINVKANRGHWPDAYFIGIVRLTQAIPKIKSRLFDAVAIVVKGSRRVF